MNKIIIVGHSASGLAEVETQLRHDGLKTSKLSRREGLSPAEITRSLCRAHNAPSADTPTREADFKQIEAGPVWQGMALDLLLGNLEQDWWGWANTQSIFLLEYWRELDPLATFVLVYDEPQRALAEAALYDAKDPDTTRIQQRIDNWMAYNGAMLRFFLRHPGRCLLINAQQILANPNLLCGQLAGYTGKTTTPKANVNSTGSQSQPSQVQLLQNALALTTPNPAESLRILHNDTANRYLLKHYLDGHPACMHLYEELQASASIPWHPDKTIESPVEYAWKALVAERRLTTNVISQFYQERQLLVAQLHQVQEQLEVLYLQNLILEKKLANQKVVQKPKPKIAENARIGAADRVKQQLSYRLGSILVKNTRSVGGCLAMPFALAGEIRRYRKEQKQRSSKKLFPIHTYKDSDQALRVKNQLSYRLGSVLVMHSKSPIGWLKLPFAMRREIKTFKQARSTSITVKK